MNNKKSTKRALTSSILSLVLCMAMLIGTTFAWFTDNASTNVNTIQSGDLEIALEYSEDGGTTWNDAEGKTLNFMAADKRTDILWEPGCTYKLPLIRVRNNGNLALQYKLSINGVTGDAKLLEAIEFTANGNAIRDFSGTLLKNNDTSETILIQGHMKEEATNEYENLTIKGVSIVVSATQYTYEKDSFDNQYDAGANAVKVSTVAELQNVLNDGGYAVLTADIDASTVTPKNQAFKVPQGKTAVIDLNGYTLTSKDGGGSNTMAIYVDKGAQLTLKDSVGTGEVVSSCYGVYVKQNAKFIMDGGTLTVTGNNVYDIGVTLWNSEFVMNAGTINSRWGVWASNYYRDVAGEAGLNNCSLTIADGCVLNSTSEIDVDYADALDTKMNIPKNVTFNPKPVTVTNQDELNTAIANNEAILNLSAGNYTMPTTNQEVIISGTKDTIISGNDAEATKVTLNGVTVQSTGAAYTGIKHSEEVIYNDVTIIGNMYLYAEKVVFNDCTFDLSETNDYVWVYGATNVEFNNCTFNTMGKAILIFQDGSQVDQTVKVEGCTFNASAPAYNWDKTIHVSAVSIDGSQGGTYNVILNNNEVDSNFNGLWQDKTNAGNITVTVDGNTVLEPTK